MSPWRTRMKLPGTVPPKVQNVYVTPSEIGISFSTTSSSTITFAGVVAVGRRRHVRRAGQHGLDRLALRRTEVALSGSAGTRRWLPRCGRLLGRFGLPAAAHIQGGGDGD